MTEFSQTTLTYKAGSTKSQYIDLSAGLSLLNSKNCTQFKDDKPLLFVGTIRLATGSESVAAAKNTWVVKNACVKAAAAWRRTLRSAGIRSKKKLNTYAREMRFAYNEDHSAKWGGFVAGEAASPIPAGVSDYYSTGVYNSDGDEITVYAFAPLATIQPGPSNARYKFAFSQTTAAVPQSGSTDVSDKKMNLLGSVSTTYLNVVAEYNDSRINTTDVEDTDFNASPSNDNDFIMMLAPGEEVADDVLDNVDDEGKWRPYTTADSQTEVSVITPGANVAGQDTMFEAPLGLLHWTPTNTDSKLVIDILAIHEM